MNHLVQSLFWLLAALLAYTFAGYPLLINLLARRRSPAPERPVDDARCSMVISAYNEAHALPAKLRALLDGPDADRIGEIWIGSDGSTDGTDTLIAAWNDPRIHLVHHTQRRGKPSILNELIPQCAHELVVLTDARQCLADGAIPALLAHFADPLIGAVSGELIFREADTPSSTATGMGVYWHYEKWIRKAEARFRSVPGATGALYAIRRDTFCPIPADLLLDDVAIPMQIIQQGFRCGFEPAAIVYDVPSPSAAAEETRKRRTIAGNIQLVARYPQWLLPWHNPIWFEFVSHKMLRLISPALLAGLVPGSMALALGQPEPARTLYTLLAALQGAFYLVAVPGLCGWSHHPLTAGPALFLRLNWTTVCAWFDAARRAYRVDWQRTTTP
jgi:poly-beta-1,6-N-acetyl-D-glucosamine synthase